jgi:hypothetical protein
MLKMKKEKKVFGFNVPEEQIILLNRNHNLDLKLILANQ